MLKADGYAGLTTAKVAARSGQNKALIGYHFGSKQGLVAAVARELSAAITEELLEGIGEPREREQLRAGSRAGWPRSWTATSALPRLYFDLASQSIVDPEVRAIMREMKAGFRRVLTRSCWRGSATARAARATRRPPPST